MKNELGKLEQRLGMWSHSGITVKCSECDGGVVVLVWKSFIFQRCILKYLHWCDVCICFKIKGPLCGAWWGRRQKRTGREVVTAEVGLWACRLASPSCVCLTFSIRKFKECALRKTSLRFPGSSCKQFDLEPLLVEPLWPLCSNVYGEAPATQEVKRIERQDVWNARVTV